VFLLRSSPWSKALLRVWYGVECTSFETHPHWEQAALTFLLASSAAAASACAHWLALFVRTALLALVNRNDDPCTMHHCAVLAPA
jgi:hypothetical protein